MFYRYLLLAAMVFGFSSFQFAPETKRAVDPVANFSDGEFLEFSISYGLINGGKAELTVNREMLDGKPYMHSRIYGHTSGVLDAFYKVRDVYESWFDERTNMPVKGIRNVREGKYKHYDEITYFQEQGYVTSTRKGKVEVPPNSLDMACAFYYLRRIDFSDFKVGDIVYMDTYFNGKHFPFYVEYKGKEELSIGLGTFRALVFVPVVEPGRVFERKDGMTIWFSDDENKIPLRIRFDAVVGAFKCDLITYKNLKYPLKSMIK